MTEEEMSQKIEANTQALKELQAITMKTARYLKWLRIMELIKWLLIIAPLVAAYFYLPMLLQGLSSSYGQLLPSGVELPSGLNSLIK